MRRGLIRWLPALLAMGLSGCLFFHYQPYGHMGTWLMRDNARPQYFADYDVFVVHQANFDWEFHYTRVVRLYDLLKQRIAERFGRKVRIFAPLLHDDDVLAECELALDYYLENFRDEGRPFAVLVIGRDEEFYREFQKRCSSALDRKNACAIMHHSVSPDFVADGAFVKRVARAVEELKYERRWHRPEPPEDLAKALSVDALADLPVIEFSEDAPSLRASNQCIPLRSGSVTNAPSEAVATNVPPVAAVNADPSADVVLEEPPPGLPPVPDEEPKESVREPVPQDSEPQPSDPIDVPPRPSITPAYRETPQKGSLLQGLMEEAAPGVQVYEEDM